MADVLSAYLCEAGRRRFEWGEFDCFLFVADWVHRATGIDPAGEYRGAYTSRQQARKLLKANGREVAFASYLMARAGFAETSDPAIGDVALVRVVQRYIDREAILVAVGAIRVRHDLWAVKTQGASIAMGNFPVMVAWSISGG